MVSILLYVCALVTGALGQTPTSSTSKLNTLNSLKTRATLLETTLKREQAILSQRQVEVSRMLVDIGSQGSACYKRLNAIEEFLKPKNQTQCFVNPALIRSCSDWSRAGYWTNGDYTIDPDGPGGLMPFRVECRLINPKNPKDTRLFTVIHHDSEMRADVGKCKGQLCFKKNLKYQASLEQIKALKKVSHWCNQQTRYYCYSSRLLKGGFGAWYNLDGKKMNYWGGAKSGSGQCSCGRHNNCINNSTTCNCDVGAKYWNIDDGYAASVDVPVTKLAFGDTDGPDKAAYYTIGPLTCYGR